jgi:anti-sigma factor RsiW
MSTIAHPATPEEIMAFVDGELPADRTQFLSTHLESCAECREAAAAFRKGSHGLSSWTVAAVPTQVEDQVQAASQNMPRRPIAVDSNGSLHIGGWVWKHWVLGLGATAVALVVLFAMATPNLQRRSQSSFAVDGTHAKPMTRVTTAYNTPTVSPNGQGLDALKEEVAQPDEESQNGHVSAYVSKLPAAASQGKLQAAEPRVNEPMIARTVSLSVVVKRFDAARASLDAILARHNGYAAGLNVATPESAARTLQASLRIPAAKLAGALSELKALGRVEAETQNGEEVTQQHADLVARLKNSRETEQRLQAILLQRTGKISDVLAVEQEIARVRGEIEQMEAEQQTLEHRVSFATIDLRLTEEYKAQLSSPTPSVGTQLRNATVNGFRNAFEGVLSLVLFFAESGPTLLLWLAVLFLPARLLWRRYQRVYATTASLGA